jgi:hypothetical protein
LLSGVCASSADGKEYLLAKNNGENSLHGGQKGSQFPHDRDQGWRVVLWEDGLQVFYQIGARRKRREVGASPEQAGRFFVTGRASRVTTVLHRWTGAIAALDCPHMRSNAPCGGRTLDAPPKGVVRIVGSHA